MLEQPTNYKDERFPAANWIFWVVSPHPGTAVSSAFWGLESEVTEGNRSWDKSD